MSRLCLRCDWRVVKFQRLLLHGRLVVRLFALELRVALGTRKDAQAGQAAEDAYNKIIVVVFGRVANRDLLDLYSCIGYAEIVVTGHDLVFVIRHEWDHAREGGALNAALLYDQIIQLELKQLMDVRISHVFVLQETLNMRQPLCNGLREHAQGFPTIAEVIAVRVSGDLGDHFIGNNAFQKPIGKVRRDRAERLTATLHKQLLEVVDSEARKNNSILEIARLHLVAREHEKAHTHPRLVLDQPLEDVYKGFLVRDQVEVAQHDKRISIGC